MPTLWVLRGVPGCGKSTFASKILAENPGTIRINRDSIRKEMFGYEAPDSDLNRSLEYDVTNIQDILEQEAVNYGYNVVLDNVNGYNINLTLFKNADYNIIFVYFDTPVETCVRRAHDRRSRVVPAGVIYGMLQKYPHLDPEHEKWGTVPVNTKLLVVHHA
jgi:predicted kinase